MRKIRSLIAAVMVVVIQITPGPLGLQRAEAAVPLGAVVVGALISASLVAGAGVYAPESFDPGQIVVDGVTGEVHRSVLVAKMLGVGAESQMMGVAGQITLGFQSTYDWVTSHLADYPTIGPVYQATSQLPYYVPGTYGGETNTPDIPANSVINILYYADSIASLFGTSYDPLKRIQITSAWTPSNSSSWSCQPASITNRLPTVQTYGTVSNVIYAYVGTPESYCVTQGKETVRWYNAASREVSTSEALTPFPPVVSPQTLRDMLPNTYATADEIDKVAAENPAAVIEKPVAFTSAQTALATAQAAAVAAQAAAVAAQTAADADPTNTALQVAAAQAVAAAAQAEIAAQGEQAKFEAQEETAEPDVPYNPTGLGGPYTLPEVDFGQRLQQFIDSAKASSIFSLPGTVFGNIPGAGSSQMTINGGQIFGTHIFDFADLSSMWVVLRGIVLTGFSFVAVRVVTLKR